jgi:hypothetical protein
MTRIPVGDIAELLGAGALIASAALWSGLVLALAVAGAALVYVGNCFADTTITVGSDAERTPHS